MFDYYSKQEKDLLYKQRGYTPHFVFIDDSGQQIHIPHSRGTWLTDIYKSGYQKRPLNFYMRILLVATEFFYIKMNLAFGPWVLICSIFSILCIIQPLFFFLFSLSVSALLSCIFFCCAILLKELQLIRIGITNPKK